jgi:hypothetical protein
MEKKCHKLLPALPAKEDLKETVDYDDFHESHTPLATAFHKSLKSRKLHNTHRIKYDSSIITKFYHSKSECCEARDSCIRKAYNQAEKYLTPGNSKSLSKEAAEFYSKQIDFAFSSSQAKLETLCSLIGAEDLYNTLMEKADKSYKALRTEFENELNDNSDYYSMYDFDYFIGQVNIEEHDYRIADNSFMLALETLFTDHIQYTITDIYPAISELQNDLNTYSNTFFGAAFGIYRSYVEELENLLDRIGNGLPEMEDDEDVGDYISRCCVKKAV